MAVIGFAIIALIGGILLIQGVLCVFLLPSLSGKPSYGGFLLMIIGLVILYVDYLYIPFTLSFNFK